MKSLHELFEDGMKDMYNAEKQLTKALPKMAKMAKNAKLRQGFQDHLKQTEGHIARLEKACQSIGCKPTGMVCRAMKGIVEEASEHMKGLKASACTDAELIWLAQKVEHYEIGSYGTLCAWAELMGHTEAQELLQMNLTEEKQTNDLLTEIAQTGVNQMAANESKDIKMKSGGTMGTHSKGASQRRTTPMRRSATGHSKTGTKTMPKKTNRKASPTRSKSSRARASAR